MTLSQLEVFIAVCQEKSFTKAAEMLHMTQSAVSQAISSLETELGVRLLVRDRHKITITLIGERVLSHARSVIQHIFEIKQESLAASGIETGTVRIGATQGVTAQFLPGLLGSFRASNPNFQVNLIEGSQDEVHSWLMNHRIDVGFTVLPTETFNAVGLLRDPFLLFVPKDHRLSKSTVATLHQILDDSYIQLKADSAHLINEVFRKHGVTPPVQFELGETSAILEMVQQGLGVTILPQLAIPGYMMPDVVSISLDPKISRDVGFLVRDMNRVPPACADFILHAQKYVANSHKWEPFSS